MKKVLLIMAAALMTMTQCKKQETMPVTPSANTIKMTVTAGSGAKTDINTETGAIKWSAGDKLYVSDGTSWLGSLTLVSGADTPQGTFTGSVTGLDDEGAPCHFFYLGKGNIATTPTGTAAVSISLASQDGTLRGENGAMKYHAGYGRTNVTVKSGEYQGYVEMNTKIAIAHINFTTDGTTAYTGSVTMGGTGISNTLSVNPDGSFSGSGTDGITIGGTTGERYVTLIPTGTTDVLNVAFTGDATGSMTFAKGIHENKFYGMSNAIEVPVKPIEFTVDANGTKVKFSKGNLYWDGSAFRFEANQWDYRHYSGKKDDKAVIGGVSQTTPSGTVGSFFWSKTASVAYAGSYSDSGTSNEDVFFTNGTQTTANPNFQVSGEAAGTWRTLSNDEWNYLLGYEPPEPSSQRVQTDDYGRPGAKGLCAWKELDGGTHKGLVILPDGTEKPSEVLGSITKTSDLATHSAVFLPAAGKRSNSSVFYAGGGGYYWASNTGYRLDPFGGLELRDFVCDMYFSWCDVLTDTDGDRDDGCPVRLVR